MIKLTYASADTVKEFSINKDLTIEEAMAEVYAFLLGVKLGSEFAPEETDEAYGA